MQISKEIKSVKELVFELLTANPKYRDSDKKLCAKIWSIQIGGNENLKKISAYEFLTEYAKGDGKLFSTESIGRVRRKIQEDNPSLRGEKYEERNEEQSNVVSAIKSS